MLVKIILVDTLQLRAFVQDGLQKCSGGKLLPPQLRASPDGETLLPMQLLLLLLL